MSKKNIFISFVKDISMNPADKKYAGGWIEVYHPGDKYASEEIRFFTNQLDEWREFEDRWDCRDISLAQLKKLQRRVEEDFHGVFEEEENKMKYKKVIQNHHVQYPHPEHPTVPEVVAKVFKGEHHVLSKLIQYTKEDVSLGLIQALEVFIAMNKYRALDLEAIREMEEND